MSETPKPPTPAEAAEQLTADEVNALPEKVRRYIHDIETRCDPAGEVRTIACLRDQVRDLSAAQSTAAAALSRLADVERQNANLLKAIQPFADLVTETQGNIQHFRLSFSNWHALTKAYKAALPPAPPEPAPVQAAGAVAQGWTAYFNLINSVAKQQTADAAEMKRLASELEHWKGNHANEAEKNRKLRARLASPAQPQEKTNG